MNVFNINNATPPLPASGTAAANGPQATARDERTTKAQLTQAVEQSRQGETSEQEIKDAVKSVNDFLKPMNNTLQFNIDTDTGKTVIKVVDTSTKEILRQFPSEEMLSIAKAIDKMKGLLIQQKA